MLTAYLDESIESPRGYTVMAGFLGNKKQWTQFAEEWKKALLPRRNLHMADLRWKNDRHKEMLEKLGPIPHKCGLRPLYSSVAFTKGYFITLVGLTASVLLTIPKGDRIEFIFEEQTEFAAVREHALSLMANKPILCGKRGKSALAKWSSVPRSSLLEQSDYLAYAVMQNLVDANSNKSRLCLPILAGKAIGGRMGKDAVSKILEMKR